MAELICDNKGLTVNLSTSKSPKSFKEQNGAVGLGIVAAMNEPDSTIDKSGRGGPVLSVSPRSNPIPIFGPNFVNSVPNSSSAESEEYTCVTSRIGNNMIEKREYFGSEKTILMEKESEFEAADFLSSCYLCEKVLHGLDIFMYRGEKAFCSVECRYKQILSDERIEKRNSRVNKKQTKYSISPCSSQLQFFAGVVAA